MSEADLSNVNSIPLAQIGVSDPSIFGNDTWRPWFARLQAESQVHYCAESPFGAYWSVTDSTLSRSVQTMTKEEAIQRAKDTYTNVFSDIEFVLHKLLVDGEYVTLLWEMQAVTLDGEDFVYSNIEVFRVVDGEICEFWNPPQIQESNGLWE